MAALVFYQPVDPAGFPRFIYAAPAALFPLMAFFILQDDSRYRNYLPLFMAGKFLSICTLTVWLVFQRLTVFEHLLPVNLIESIFLAGDIFSICMILIIMKSLKRTDEAGKIEQITEEN